MSTPKGTKCVAQIVGAGDKVLIYSNLAQIILQLRHQVPTEEQILEPSFKVAVPLTPAEAITLAGNLLNAALPQLAALRATAEMEEKPDMIVE
ncbi:MAG: hypothetical protein ACRDHZ_27075 [Ktedonobacteraceae bacterium]